MENWGDPIHGGSVRPSCRASDWNQPPWVRRAAGWSPQPLGRAPFSAVKGAAFHPRDATAASLALNSSPKRTLIPRLQPSGGDGGGYIVRRESRARPTRRLASSGKASALGLRGRSGPAGGLVPQLLLPGLRRSPQPDRIAHLPPRLPWKPPRLLRSLQSPSLRLREATAAVVAGDPAGGGPGGAWEPDTPPPPSSQRTAPPAVSSLGPGPGP